MADEDVEKCPHCGEPLPEDEIKDPLGPLLFGGETYSFDKLSFGERKAIMRTVKELVLVGDPDANPDEDWTRDDMRVAFAIVVARRTNPDYSIEDGLELVPDDLEPVDPPTRLAPTKRAGKPSAKRKAAA